MAPGLPRATLASALGRWLSRRRFPTLFVIAAVLLGLDLIVPDAIPFADEILLALGTALLGAWQRRGAEQEAERGAAADAPESPSR